jgi:Ca-activated chloride channel family protein
MCIRDRDDAIESARKAAEKDVRIYTIGVGSPEGAPIPMLSSTGSIEYKKDETGNTVVTKLNESMLQQIATLGKGTYSRASTEDAGLDQVYKEIGKLEKAEYEAMDFTDYENLFPYFMSAGLFLLVLEFFIFERKSRLTRNFKLFSRPGSSYVQQKNIQKNASSR